MNIQVAKKEESRLEYLYRINKVVQYIDSHLDEKLSLELLAETAYFSPFHFHRIFKAMTGETPNEFIARLRLERAANYLLYHPKASMIETALEAGFSSSSNFTKTFTPYFGMSPSKWRKEKLELYKDSPLPKTHTVPVKKDSIDASTGTDFDVRIEKTPALRLAYLAHSGPYDMSLSLVWEKLMTWVQKRQLFRPQTKRIGVIWDNPSLTPPEKCRYYAGVSIPQDVETDGEIGTYTIPGGIFAVCPYLGTVEEIEQAYYYLLAQWFPESGYVPKNIPSYQLYWDSNGDIPEGMMKMEIYFPVTPLRIRGK
ncbi:MAG: AraC family transcriptional regulator [bacterium]|nr:AraC family transcriptional regulator [bacterium]